MRNLAAEVERLSDPDTYYQSSYPPQLKCDKANYRQQRKCLVKIQRLSKVIAKQANARRQDIRFNRELSRTFAELIFQDINKYTLSYTTVRIPQES